MTLLVLDKVTKHFGDHVAVDGLSLAVETGEFVALLGPSGCGKTTTLQMIAGFADVTSGTIMLEGRDLTTMRPSERGLGIVFQSYALFPHMTAAENVAFGLEMQGVPAAERAKRVSETLALVGLAGFEGRFPRRMSGGQQQRVALARAIVIKPRILLLDEPLSNLDAKLREEMQIELRQIQRTLGTTTILVTHDQAEAMALSDRIVVMSKGRVEQIATPQELYDRPQTHFVRTFLGKMNVLTVPVAASGGASIARLGGGTIPIDRPIAAFPGGHARLTVRPERVRVEPDGTGLPGRVAMRVFQGNHWLLRIELAPGVDVLVIAPNAGREMPGEGSAVALSWQPDDMHVEPATGALA